MLMGDVAYYSRGTELLREALQRAGLTQQQLADDLQTSAANVSRWVSGERRPGALWTFELQARFGIDPRAWWQNAAAA